MKRYRLCLCVGLILVTLVAVTRFSPVASGAVPRPSLYPSPRQQVQAAWQQARQAGAYDYSTTIVQTTWPLPRLENVGLSSSQQRIYLEGSADLSAETLR